MSLPEIPARPEHITPEWLTEALRSTGVLVDSRVVSVDASPLEGGFLGQYARLGVRYDVKEAKAPESMFLKLPSLNTALREFCVKADLYSREVHFYEHLSGVAGVRVPRCYYGKMSGENGAFVLILEDIASARSGGIVTGCSVDDAEIILTRLARLHARWWKAPGLTEFEWLRPLSALSEIVVGLYEGWLRQCVERVRLDDAGALTHIGERVGANLDHIFDRLSRSPQTLVHGDFWISNILFLTEEGNDPFVVIDWQLTSRGRGALDAGYFMWSLSVEDRRRHDTDLLRTYHSALIENGVVGYDFDHLWEDYRLSWLYSFVLFIWTIADVESSEHELQNVLVSILERLVVAITDLDSLDVLPHE